MKYSAGWILVEMEGRALPSKACLVFLWGKSIKTLFFKVWQLFVERSWKIFHLLSKRLLLSCLAWWELRQYLLVPPDYHQGVSFMNSCQSGSPASQGDQVIRLMVQKSQLSPRLSELKKPLPVLFNRLVETSWSQTTTINGMDHRDLKIKLVFKLGLKFHESFNRRAAYAMYTLRHSTYFPG